MVLYRASFWGGNLESELISVIGIPPTWCRIRKRYQPHGNNLGGDSGLFYALGHFVLVSPSFVPVLLNGPDIMNPSSVCVCVNHKQQRAGGIIGPYFFKNDEGHNVTVNGDRYRAMITNFFIPELNNHDVQELWFQQDGATCHTIRATIDLLKDTFGDRLISRFGPVNWPPRSCDLTPLDYFLWDYVKSLVYADKPQTLDHLEENILRVIAGIRPQMLEKVIEKWTSRLDYIRASRGSHMPEIIFKM
ncbi:putative LOC100569746 [Trichonephila clavipes]|nr:putative LOC100569746 [Trichonephila clavipes]